MVAVGNQAKHRHSKDDDDAPKGGIVPFDMAVAGV
jgi:hypothetical protein